MTLALQPVQLVHLLLQFVVAPGKMKDRSRQNGGLLCNRLTIQNVSGTQFGVFDKSFVHPKTYH